MFFKGATGRKQREVRKRKVIEFVKGSEKIEPLLVDFDHRRSEDGKSVCKISLRLFRGFHRGRCTLKGHLHWGRVRCNL